MPLYRELARGYEMVYQPINGHLIPTHRLADEWNIRGGLYADTPGTHRHYIDFDRRNGGDRSMAELLARYGPLPETARDRTGNGGHSSAR